MHRLLAAIAIWALSASAGAQETWYDVELIVFGRADQKYADSEVWPTEFSPLEHKRVAVLEPPPPSETASLAPFQQLPETALLLVPEWQKLQQNPTFEPLVHVGWRQRGLAREEAVAVRLGNSDLLPPADAAPAAPAEEDEATAPADAGEAAVPAMLPRLEGTVRLILSRYLHLETDLHYRTPEQAIGAEDPQAAPPFEEMVGARAAGIQGGAAEDETSWVVASESESSPTPPPVYVLRDSRRMRSRELHYVDHPMFGLLVQVTPYEPPKEPEKPAVAAPSPVPAAAKPLAPPDPTKGGTIRRN